MSITSTTQVPEVNAPEQGGETLYNNYQQRSVLRTQVVLLLNHCLWTKAP